MSLVVYKFSAEWCGPCKILAGPWHKIVDEYKDSVVDFIEVDVDEEPELAQRYGIQSIPTLMFVKDNIVANSLVGLHTEEVMKQVLEEFIEGE